MRQQVTTGVQVLELIRRREINYLYVTATEKRSMLAMSSRTLSSPRLSIVILERRASNTQTSVPQQKARVVVTSPNSLGCSWDYLLGKVVM